MGLDVNPKSVSFLAGIDTEGFKVEEYRAAGHSSMSISGPSVEQRADDIISRFEHWYPHVYGTSTRKAKDKDGNFVLVLERWLSCD